MFEVSAAGEGAEAEIEVKTRGAELATLMEGRDCPDDVAIVAAGTEETWTDELNAAGELLIGPAGSAASAEAAFGTVSHWTVTPPPATGRAKH